MSSIEKIIDKMKNQPNGIKFSEIERILNYMDFYETRQKGSHKRFKNNNTDETLTLPVQNPLKSVYIKQILKLLGDETKWMQMNI